MRMAAGTEIGLEAPVAPPEVVRFRPLPACFLCLDLENLARWAPVTHPSVAMKIAVVLHDVGPVVHQNAGRTP